jgi:hypothetical protein
MLTLYIMSKSIAQVSSVGVILMTYDHHTRETNLNCHKWIRPFFWKLAFIAA